MTASDGSALNVRLEGDEHFHQYYTEDGYPIIEKGDDFYFCDIDSEGNIRPSDFKAVNPNFRNKEVSEYLKSIDLTDLGTRVRARALKSPRRKMSNNASSESIRKINSSGKIESAPYAKGYGLNPGNEFPSYGKQKAIAILVEYQDVSFSTTYDAKDYFTRLLNEDGFSDYGGTGSASQYFKDNSQGIFVPEFDVYGPVLLAHDRKYYGANDIYGDDMRAEEMIIEACALIDDIVDFNDYDRDGNGIVDNIYIFYAGQGEASGGPASSVWPHQWDLDSAGYRNIYHDGVKIKTYACSNEWERSAPDGMGTFVHEFSHVLGLPDLYATSNSPLSAPFTPEEWSVLDYGPYNNNGRTPPNYGAFERYALGWTKPREINKPLSATLPQIDENICGIIRTEKDTEFFLLENRQKTGWDKYIPGHGMLIWHIDYNPSVWTKNSVNNTALHQYVDIVEADGIQDYYRRGGNAFPGTSNITSFTAMTDPALKSWGGKAINYPVTDIAETDGKITFNILGGDIIEIEALDVFDVSDMGSDSVTLNWESPEKGNMTLLNLYTKPELTSRNGEDVLEYVIGFKNRIIENDCSFSVKGLLPDITYYYTVAQTDGWNVSASSDEKSFIIPSSSGIEGISAVLNTDIRIEGLDIISSSNDLIEVYAPSGILVSRGYHYLNLPSPGIYIISLPERNIVKKMIAK